MSRCVRWRPAVRCPLDDAARHLFSARTRTPPIQTTTLDTKGGFQQPPAVPVHRDKIRSLMKIMHSKCFPVFAVFLAAGGFVSLFAGRSLNGWKLVGKKGDGYRVTNGVIYCARAGAGNLFTEKEYG